ncbi:DUF1266 domain-containing protein [Streptomyces sp. GESEQ-35]|uniref:DUF1266 domain-containing protein n=1 Tax=Streptomyces sp. GESEQ-35 TaxID=2812657 RepID=UPI001B31A63F|nr:DUF1266 domain-containing protein [Streptomyces sp. GESEQ-35]
MAIWNRRKPKAERKYPVPLTMHQLWMVSLSAPVNRDRNASQGTLYPFTRIDDDSARRWLADQWEITSREQLVGRLGGLARTGYRLQAYRLLGVSPLAWDAALYVDIARRGFGCGMITEHEAWTALKSLVPAVVRSYASWKEYADHCLIGRTVWREGLQGTPDAGFPAPQADADAHLRSLLDPANKSSPWNLAPWDIISNPDRTR